MTRKIKDSSLKIVSSQESGARLDRCLRLWCAHLPQSLVEKASRKGLLTINGQKAQPSDRVQEGQTVAFPSSFLSLSTPTPLSKPLVLTPAERSWLQTLILYQDKELIVLNKPAGIAVQSGTQIKKSLDVLMKAYDSKGTPRLVHRLDQDTSGLLVFARTLPMARWLTQSFKDRTIEKTYWALVQGVPLKAKGVICLPLSKKPEKEKIKVDSEAGLPATTFYRVMQTFSDGTTWLELKPKTGRTHQLRIHCAESLKTPIVGDRKYGGKAVTGKQRTFLHLHAAELILPLPMEKNLRFRAPLPPLFQEEINKKRPLLDK